MNNQTDTVPFNVENSVENLETLIKTSNTRTSETLRDEQRFVERDFLDQDEFFEYARKGREPGKLVIFNQEFENDDDLNRKGSRRDVNEILICFQRLGFNIDGTKDICNDFTYEAIMAKLDSILQDKEALKEANCLIIFFLTHGESDEQLRAKDKKCFKTHELWDKFKDCTELENKPKMFVIQACKGNNYSTTSGESECNQRAEMSKIISINNFTADQLDKDMLVVYATIEGNVSFRNPLTGTWFIQELCKNFLAYGRRDDVLTIITRTTKCVCANYYNYSDKNDGPKIQKQMPVFVSKLSKKFYLNRNKDRTILLNIQKDTKEIYTMVAEIMREIGHENSNI